jgi:hypothetical protein
MEVGGSQELLRYKRVVVVVTGTRNWPFRLEGSNSLSRAEGIAGTSGRVEVVWVGREEKETLQLLTKRPSGAGRNNNRWAGDKVHA